MKEKTTEGRSSSRVAWESLEGWALEIQDTAIVAVSGRGASFHPRLQLLTPANQRLPWREPAP